MNKLKGLKTDSVNLQTVFNILSMAIRGGISYLTMPIFTRLLGAEQYGYYSIYLSWCGVITCFMGLQCGSSLATRYYKYDDYRDYKSGLFTFCLLLSLAFTLILSLFSESIGGIIELSRWIVIVMSLEAVASFVFSYAGNAWVYEKKAQKNMIFTALNAVLNVILSIVLICSWKTNEKYIARVMGSFVPSVLLSIIISIDIFKQGSCKLNKDYIKYGLSFGIPIIFHMLSQYVLAQSDRLMMQKMGVNMSDIGIYSYVYGYSMILLTILNALGNSWTPFLYDNLKKKKYEEANKTVRNYVELFTILCCGFLLVGKEGGKLFGNEEFWSGIKLIPVFVTAVYCVFTYQFAVSYESFVEKPRYIAIMTVLAAIINIILNWILIPTHGMIGAAIATVISYLLLAIFHLLLVHVWKYEKYPLKIRPVLVGGIAIIATCISFYLLYDLWLLRWIVAIILGMYLIITVVKRKRIF